MDRDEQVCPVCGQPVATVVRRHKTLGAWVPQWGPGPCRNSQCAVYVAEAEEGSRDKQPGEPAARNSSEGGEGTAGAPPKKATK